MIPWIEIDRANVPESKQEIILRRRGSEFSIRTKETELMNSRIHGSEEVLAQLACHRIKKKHNARILIGGLGMGYTLAAALEYSAPDTQITVSELIGAVIKWNLDHLGHLAVNPMKDSRVSVIEEDVAITIKKNKSFWNAILLDVDNGPEGLTRKANDCLYGKSGIRAAYLALKPRGVMAVWSSAANETFSKRLKQCGFSVKTKTVKARKSGKGSRHTIWIAERL